MTEPTAPTITSAVVTVHRIFTATLVIGVPGSGKTTLFKGYSEYLWETYKRILLLYSTDGGAIPTDVQKRMKQGLIRFWRMRTRSAPGLGLETMYLASKGYWPRYINAETGETSPAVQLVPPVSTSYAVSCPKGHPLATVPVPSLIVPMFCTPCGAFVPQPELQVQETSTRTKGFETVGGVGFDGLTSFTDGVLDHMDLSRGEGNIGGEKAAFGGVVKSGSLNFGGNNRADVGFGQTRGHQFVNNSLSIPHLVEGPVWTALAMEATDEGGLPIVGPKLPGRAATDEASAWFGNVFETGKSENTEGKSCFTLWLRPFTDPQNRRHLLKTGASPSGLPDLLRDPPAEALQPYTVVNLGSVFKMLDEDLRRSLLEELPGAPGTPHGIVEYGDALTVQAGPAQVADASGIAPLMTPVPRGQQAQSAPAAAVSQAPPSVGTTVGVSIVPGAAAAPAGNPLPATPPPTMGAAGAVQAPPGPTGPALMIAKPRSKRGSAPQTMPAPMAVVETSAPAPDSQTAPVAASAAPLAAPVVASPVATPAPSETPTAAQPVAGSPPPPPGMKPPKRAPTFVN